MPDQSTFAARHIGPDSQAIAAMLDVIGVASLDELAAKAVPTGIASATVARTAVASSTRKPAIWVGFDSSSSSDSFRNWARRASR